MHPVLLFGSLIGSAQLVATLIVFALGLHATAEQIPKAQMPESLIGFIFMMIGVALAHRAGRKLAEAQSITPTVGREAKAAGLLALIAGLVTGIGQYAYLAFINPALRELQHSIILASARPELAKLSEDAAYAIVEKIDYATSAAARGIVYGLNTLVFTALLGIAFALVFKAAVKRDLTDNPENGKPV